MTEYQMKEYHYYEFQVMDQPLTKEDRQVISRLSNRLQLTPNQAIFIYYKGNFPGDPQEVLLRYFDAMLYLTNWGTKHLMFRLPKALVDIEVLQQYTLERYVSFSVVREYVLLNIYCADDGNRGWIDGEGWLPALLPLRKALLRQDYRVLYLAWLMAIQRNHFKQFELPLREPPVPAGLQELSDSLSDFVEFFKIDGDLLRTAAEASPELPVMSDDMLTEAVKRFSRNECENFLSRLLQGEPHIPVILHRRIQDMLDFNHHERASDPSERRETLALLQAAKHEEEQLPQEAPLTAENPPEKAALETLSQHEPQLWIKVNALIERKQIKAYREAVQILSQLKEVAEYQGTETAFQEHIAQLQKKYSRLSGFRSRLAEANLLAK